MLTSPNNYDTILNDDRGTDFLLPKWAFSRCRNLTVPLSSTEQSPFYLEGKMPRWNNPNCGFQKGLIPWNKGTKGICKPNITSFKKGEHYSVNTEFKKGMIPWIKGKKNHIKIPLPQWYKKGEISMQGKKHWNWKNGITPLSDKIRHSQKYILWRKQIFERDNYICQICGNQGITLQVDHYPKTFAQILYENHIQFLKDALVCKEFWDTTLNRTICLDCHKLTKTYFKNYKKREGIYYA